MDIKLNPGAVQAYAQRFARRVLDPYFSRQQAISGPQITNLSDIRQVNLFALRTLYERWQQEAERLRSPFFDYAHPKVQEALKKFMNTLSQHISVSRKDLEPILVEAVADAIALSLAPAEYFIEQVKHRAQPTITVTQLRSWMRYVDTNKVILQGVIDDIGTMRPEVYAGEATRHFLKARHDHSFKLMDRGEAISAFAAVVPVRLGDLVQEDEEAVLPAAQAELFAPARPAEEARVAPSGERNDSTEEPQTEPTDTQTPQNKPAESDTAAETPPEPVSEEALPTEKPAVVAPAEERPAVQPQMLNERLATEKVTLNERLKAETPTLADRHAAAPIGSLRDSVSLNQKFRFINQLFGGEASAWQEALRELDESPTMEGAQQILREKYAPRYAWADAPEPAQEFYQLVARKFGQ